MFAYSLPYVYHSRNTSKHGPRRANPPGGVLHFRPAQHPGGDRANLGPHGREDVAEQKVRIGSKHDPVDASVIDATEPQLSELDDPAFLAERRRVRRMLEHIPEHEVTPKLSERMRELDEEFIRRARLAWQDAG
jgi:hypothetical protein